MRGLWTLTMVAVLALSACSASQDAADAAIEEAESAITAQHADAMRFAPEAFAAVMETYGAAREAYENEDWRGAIAKAEETAAQARQIGPAIAQGKEQATARWPAARDSTRSMLTAIGERLDTAARSRRYPEGMTAADVRTARSEVDSLLAGLGRATRAFEQGDLTGAVHAMERVRMQAGGLAGKVGLPPANPHGM